MAAVTYCTRCGERMMLRHGDPTTGARVGGHAFCPVCFPPLAAHSAARGQTSSRLGIVRGLFRRV